MFHGCNISLYIFNSGSVVSNFNFKFVLSSNKIYNMIMVTLLEKYYIFNI